MGGVEIRADARALPPPRTSHHLSSRPPGQGMPQQPQHPGMQMGAPFQPAAAAAAAAAGGGVAMMRTGSYASSFAPTPQTESVLYYVSCSGEPVSSARAARQMQPGQVQPGQGQMPNFPSCGPGGEEEGEGEAGPVAPLSDPGSGGSAAADVGPSGPPSVYSMSETGLTPLLTPGLVDDLQPYFPRSSGNTSSSTGTPRGGGVAACWGAGDRASSSTSTVGSQGGMADRGGGGGGGGGAAAAEGMSLTASSGRGRRRQGRRRLLAWRQAERLERLVRERLRRPARPKEKAPRHARRPQSEQVICWYPNETHDET